MRGLQDRAGNVQNQGICFSSFLLMAAHYQMQVMSMQHRPPALSRLYNTFFC